VRRIALLAVAMFPLSAGVAEAAHRTDGSTPAPANIARSTTHVPASTLNQVGAGKIFGQRGFTVTKLSGAPLMSGGKPALLASELAWCPHCAADSWALAVALSRFGSLSGLRLIDSGTLYGTKYHAHPSFPHTNGISFFGARYRSPYLSFVDVTLQDVGGHNLQRPTPAEQNAVSGFDSQGIIPAVDIGGIYGFVNSGFSPGALAHKSWSQIADSLKHAKSPIAQRVDGLANLFSAAICKATNGQPAAVCDSSGVLAAGAARLR
jgi:hypothetical protein